MATYVLKETNIISINNGDILISKKPIKSMTVRTLSGSVNLNNINFGSNWANIKFPLKDGNKSPNTFKVLYASTENLQITLNIKEWGLVPDENYFN